ncbi:hypothetical protein [Legionella sp.]|uniref:hypothetical protein n=1 Tax=Legionella sp. TaxID=459 RepID=UPI003CC05656
MIFSLKSSKIKLASVFLSTLFLINTPYAAKNPYTIDKDGVVGQNFFPYYSLGGGYGNFQSMHGNTGDTGFSRLAIGSLFNFRPYILVGAELGVQSGSRMQLSSRTTAPFFIGVVDPLPVFLTIYPLIDILGTLKYHFTSPIFAQVKAGGVYMKSMITDANIHSTSQWNAELQVGAGYDVTTNTRLILSYQRFFGNTQRLSQVNLEEGTARYANMPTWQGGLVSIEVNF